jgi:uncharacterized protein (DUF2236 family)
VTTTERRAPRRPAPSPEVPRELERSLNGVAALLAGTANVIMQLSWPGVGYGVLESKVDSGNVMRHPLKRFRTTFTYLSVVMLGTDDERARYREAVNTSHRLVRSDENSPVKYNAFDPELQLWVAACLYYGTVDIVERMYGRPSEAALDEFYAYGARFGTTLQVRPEMWPANRAAFERYWQQGLRKVSIDEPVRQYLTKLMDRSYLPWPLSATGRSSTWVTTGFLPELFREQMHLTWSERDERRFGQLMRAVGLGSRLLPGPVRRFPFNWFIHDLRLRSRWGRPLV